MEENVGEEVSGEVPEDWLARLRAIHPEVDVAALAGGSMAGLPSTDRPEVPVWEYLEYVAERPKLTLDALAEMRFPIALHAGTTMVTSIAEMLAPGPHPPTYQTGPEDVVQLYRFMHEAGALVWNPVTRTHEEVLPPASYRGPVYEKWRRYLHDKSVRRML
jgi:hypothetical protein